MYSVSSILLVSFLMQAYLATQIADAQVSKHIFNGKLVDKLSDEMTSRMLPALPLHQTNLDDSMLEKPRYLATPTSRLSPSSFHSFSGSSFPAAFPLAWQSQLGPNAIANRALKQKKVQRLAEAGVKDREGSDLALPMASDTGAATTGSIYDQLTDVQVTRASDDKRVELTSLWRKDLAFGLGGERAVVVFLRHFG